MKVVTQLKTCHHTWGKIMTDLSGFGDIEGVSAYGKKWKRLCQHCKHDLSGYAAGKHICPNCGRDVND